MEWCDKTDCGMRCTQLIFQLDGAESFCYAVIRILCCPEPAFYFPDVDDGFLLFLDYVDLAS